MTKGRRPTLLGAAGVTVTSFVQLHYELQLSVRDQ
jgi:hypothetical protein